MSAPAEGVLDGENAVPFHRGLEGQMGSISVTTTWAPKPAQGLGAALADVAVAADDGDLAGDHDVGGALDAVDERLAAAVEVVELRLGDGVVHVDRGDAELAGLRHLVKAVHAGGGLLGNALPVLQVAGELDGVLRVDAAEEVLDDGFLFAFGGAVDEGVVPFLELGALVDEEGRVTTVVDDELGPLPSAR